MFITYFLFLSIGILITGFEQEDGYPRIMDREIRKIWGQEFPSRTILQGSDSLCVINGFTGRFLEMKDSSGLERKFAWQGRVFTCGHGGCAVAIPGRATIGFEYFDYFILYNEDASVASVRIYDYRATYGHEVCSKAWLKQFNGYCAIGMLRPGKEVDAISGATVSVNAISFDVAEKSQALVNLIK